MRIQSAFFGLCLQILRSRMCCFREPMILRMQIKRLNKLNEILGMILHWETNEKPASQSLITLSDLWLKSCCYVLFKNSCKAMKSWMFQ
nr:hypothetical protein Iba_chr01aCG8740 [Ipomoea batatas]